MSTDIATKDSAASALEHILATGDLAQLSPYQRVAHYLNLTESLGLNALSRPFDWLILDGKLVLYPNKSCAEQLRRQHQISVKVLRRDIVGDMFVCEVEGRTPNGRTDQASKYVPLKAWDKQAGQLKPLSGQNLANAFAKAETGAKRRLVLSMVGLASPPDLDEVKSARVVIVDERGNVITHPTPEQRYLSEQPRASRAIGEPVFEDADVEPFEGQSQAVTAEELERPKDERPRATLKNTDEQINEWQRGWFAAVKGLSLDTDEARARFVKTWTAEWTKGRQTDSLPTMFKRMTSVEAGDFLAHVRALMEEERAALLEAAGSDDGDEPEAAF